MMTVDAQTCQAAITSQTVLTDQLFVAVVYLNQGSEHWQDKLFSSFTLSLVSFARLRKKERIKYAPEAVSPFFAVLVAVSV